MVVQQGKLTATNTTKTMEDYYTSSPVLAVSDVTRGIHNTTQFIRLVLQRPQPESAVAFTASGSVTIDVDEYVDGSFASFPTVGVSQVTVDHGTLVTTSSIVVYSTTFIDEIAGNWTVQTSLNNLESEFDNAAFDAAVTSVTNEIIEANKYLKAVTN